MADDEVTLWMHGLANGDSQAAQRLWERYCTQLANLARRKLGSASRRVVDEEDVALNAFNSFCRGVSAGSFPSLTDRHSLWKLLVTITARKAVAEIRHQNRKRRGEGQVRGESVFGHPDASIYAGIGEAMGREPTPEFAAEMMEQCARLLAQLKDPVCRDIALRKFEGHSNEEIARELNCALRTVERKLAQIRGTWSESMGDGSATE